MSLQDFTAETILNHNPYIPGKQPAGHERILKLNTNENPYPPTPRVSDIILEQVNKLNRYPNSSAQELRETIAKLHSVDSDQVIVGNGSDDILNLCVRCFSDNEKSVGMLSPSYSLYDVLSSLQGAETKKIPYDNEKFDIEPQTIIQSGTNLFFVTSPHAPTGRIYKNTVFSSILNEYSGILVVDEAYADFAPNNAVSLLRENENLIITRTLSKSYSLAGLRVGYALASREIVCILNKAREVYNVDRIAQVIAQSALEDREYFNHIINKIISVREKVYTILKDWRWITYQSGANFLFTQPIDSDGSTGEEVAKKLYRFLNSKNVFVRYFPDHSLTSSFLRISIGKEEEMDMIINLINIWKTKEHLK